MDASVSIGLRKAIYDVVGSGDGKKIIDLLLKFGVDVVTEMSGISVKLPGVEIQSISPTGQPFAASSPGIVPWNSEVARSHLFTCKINGEQNPMIQRVEIDPFDYSNAEILRVRLTLIPFGIEKEHGPPTTT